MKTSGAKYRYPPPPEFPFRDPIITLDLLITLMFSLIKVDPKPTEGKPHAM